MTEHKQPDWTELEAAAREATPGPWSELHNMAGPMGVIAGSVDDERMPRVCWLDMVGKEHANARYIALANPETILSLLSELREAGMYTAAHEALDDLARERIAAAEARASTAEAGLARIRDEYGVNHTSKWARELARALLSPPPGEEGGRGSSGAERAGAPACGAATDGLCKSKMDRLRQALAVFAAIKPSDLYPADGSEAEPYVIMLHDPRMLGQGGTPDFTGADLAIAREAIAKASAHSQSEGEEA